MRVQRVADRVVAELLAELVDELALVAVGGVADDLPDALEERELAGGLAEEELDDRSDGESRIDEAQAELDRAVGDEGVEAAKDGLASRWEGRRGEGNAPLEDVEDLGPVDGARKNVAGSREG